MWQTFKTPPRRENLSRYDLEEKEEEKV